MKKKLKFVIVSFRQICGGPIVLHALCKYLSELGYDARIFYSEEYVYKKGRKLKFWFNWAKRTAVDTCKIILVKFFKNRINVNSKRFSGYYYKAVSGCKRKLLPFVDKNTVVVYPEVTYGNFLKAKNVVRWLLYYNRFYDQNNPDSYESNDLFFCYREVFNDTSLNPEGNKLKTPYFDLELYKQYNFGERDGKCYIVRKGKDRSDLPEIFDGTVIDELTEKEIVDVFNKCEYCISYDTQTAYSYIAALCGCTSIVIPEPGKCKEDYIGSDDDTLGVAWGYDEKEIAFAKQTQQQLIERYIEINKSGKRSAKEFAEYCESHFKI